MTENYEGNVGGNEPQSINPQPNNGQPNTNYNGQPYMNYGGYDPQPKGKGDGTGLGIASMVLGILSLLLFCTCVNWITGILAIIFGIIQLVKHKEKGFAITGIATAALSLVLTICLYVSYSAAIGDYYDDYYDYYYDSYFDDYSEYYDEDYYYYDEEGNRQYMDEL